jgi:hypothetical protein
VELAAALPTGAEVCAVARPGAVAPSRRGLLRPLSQAGPLAWLGGVSVTAQAWASRSADGGRRAAVGLLRVNDPEAVVRARMASESATRLAWDGDTCDPPACLGLRATFVDARTVRIEQGTWPEGEAAGVERRCRALALARPDALEVSVRLGTMTAPDLEVHVPRWVETLLRPMEGGVLREHLREMATSGAATESRWQEVVDEGTLARGVATDGWTEQRGRVVRSIRTFAFEDLALASQDARRLRRAQAHWATTPRGQGATVDVQDLRSVREAVVRHKRALTESTEAVRRSVARDLRALLERAAAAHPGETGLAHDLVRLLLDELGDAEAAAEVARAALPRVPEAERPLWRRLWREALAQRGPAHLAPALVAHGVVPEPRAAQAAEDLAALARGGVDYEWLENAWGLAEVLGARTIPRNRIAPVALPLDTFVATLRATGTLATHEAGPHALYVLARGPAVHGADPSGDACLRFHDTDGAPTCFVAVHDPARPSAGERTLPFGLGQGAFTLHAQLVPLPAGEGQRVRHLQVEGRVRGETILIEGTSSSVGADGWGRVHRYLGLPLATPERRVFPPPELLVDAEGVRAATRLLRASRTVDGLACQAAGSRLSCELQSTALAEAPARALVPMLIPVLAGTADALWVPSTVEP